MPSPLYRNEFSWMRSRFTQPFELVYIDPLLCGSELWTPWSSLPGIGRVRRLRQQAFVRRISGAIKARSEDSISSGFLGPDGAGMRFMMDRKVQTKAQQEAQKHWHDIAHRMYPTVRSFTIQRNSIRQFCNQPRADSIVVVDGMLGKLTHVPKSISLTYQRPPLNDITTLRNVECILADYPAPLLTLRQPVISLVVDQNAFYNWTEDFYAILNTGWYPLTRVIGLCTMNSGGTPFIDVMAILVRPCPTFDILLEPVGTESHRCLPGTLQRVQYMALNQAIAEEEQRVTKPAAAPGSAGTPGGGTVTPPATAGPAVPAGTSSATIVAASSGGTSAASTAASGSSPSNAPTPDQRHEYPRDEEFLSPLLFFLLGCRLNNVNLAGLKDRAGNAYDTLFDYLAALRKLSQQLEKQQVQTQISSYLGTTILQAID